MAYNPPAFPTDGRIQHGTEYDGMSLRDWFAGQALAGLLAGHATYGGRTDARSVLAQDAYAHAEAMLAARKDNPNANN